MPSSGNSVSVSEETNLITILNENGCETKIPLCTIRALHRRGCSDLYYPHPFSFVHPTICGRIGGYNPLLSVLPCCWSYWNFTDFSEVAFVVFPYTPIGRGPIRLRPVWVWTGDKAKPPKRLLDILRKAPSWPPHWLGSRHQTCLNIQRGQCLTFPPGGFLASMPPYFSGVSPTDHRYTLTHVTPLAPERTGPVELCRKYSWSQKKAASLWNITEKIRCGRWVALY